MSSSKDYAFPNWHQTCIDDIITQYDSLSLSSSETDNITLDSGIYCDSKSDLIKQSVSSNVVTKSQPPPPPPYNSTHNIISSTLDSPGRSLPFQCNSNEDTVAINDSISDNCSMNDLLINPHLQNQLSLANNRFSLSRLLTEERKQNNVAFEDLQRLTESPKLPDNRQYQNSSSVKQQINQPPENAYQNSQLSQKLASTYQSALRNEPQYDVKLLEMKKEDVKILGSCKKCQTLVTDSESACIALGNLYHSNCFTCCFCSRSLRGKVFYKDQEMIYCENDYMVFGFHKSVKICNACGHIITETILEALGKDFHPRCFKCSICQTCLDGIPFTVDRNNNIYCIHDYHNTFAPRCAICLQPITPCKDSDDVVRVVVNDKDFHVECYRCQNCLRLLSNESNCFVWSTDRSSAHIKLLCRRCYVSQIRELSQLKQ